MRRRGIVLVVFIATFTAITAIGLTIHRSNKSDGVLIGTLEYEYDNGGLFQFFWNSRGKDNEATLTALQHAGFGRHADLFRRVVAVFESERATLEAAWNNRADIINAYTSAEQRSAIPGFDIEWGKLPRLVPGGAQRHASTAPRSADLAHVVLRRQSCLRWRAGAGILHA